MGSTFDNGHYVAYFFSEDNWYMANDSVITPVTWEIVSHVEAYILLYAI